MALLKLKDLHSRLEYIDDFVDPKIELEQYITTPHIAGKSVMELQISIAQEGLQCTRQNVVLRSRCICFSYLLKTKTLYKTLLLMHDFPNRICYTLPYINILLFTQPRCSVNVYICRLRVAHYTKPIWGHL